MRILFVLNCFEDPLAAVYADTARRAAALKNRGHQVEIWTRELFRQASRYPSWLDTLIFPKRIATRVAQADPDLAIFHSTSGWWYLAFHRSTKPAVIQFHGRELLCLSGR